MARSTYIYVVTLHERFENDEVLGVFTVKHEMVSTVKRWRTVRSLRRNEHISIKRLSDGLIGGTVTYLAAPNFEDFA